MATFVWTVFAVAFQIALFAGCIAVVAAATRWLENAVAKRRAKYPT